MKKLKIYNRETGEVIIKYMPNNVIIPTAEEYFENEKAVYKLRDDNRKKHEKEKQTKQNKSK